MFLKITNWIRFHLGLTKWEVSPATIEALEHAQKIISEKGQRCKK